MTTIVRFAGSTIPSYFLGRPRGMYESRYDTTGATPAGRPPMPLVVPRMV